VKIAMLGHKRMPSREGGVEVVVEELSTRMAALGHDVTVYSRKGHSVAGSEFDDTLNCDNCIEYKGVKIKQVTTVDIKGLAAASSSYFATKAAIRDKPDLIHFHAEGPCAMIGLAKRAGIRAVATIHGLDWQRAKWGRFASWYLKLGEKIAARKADEIISLSPSAQKYFRREYARETCYIPNGVDEKTLFSVDLISRKYGLLADDYFLFLGRIVPEKGVHYLIEAYKEIKTDKRLVVAGGPSDSREYFKQLQESAACDDRILFTGFTVGQELEELYSNAYAYVLPSDLEGMPISLLEAMAYGRCCLVSDIEECAEITNNCGFTFRKGDVFDLREKLEFLIANASLTKRRGADSCEFVRSHYNWDSIVKETLSVYENGRN
jgi:glycosyltransferase involved in cell wall biosynthesis